jgi:hypothetical protein
MMKPTLALLLALLPATAVAKPPTETTKLWNLNVRIVTDVLNNGNTRECSDAEWGKLSEKAREISTDLKLSESDVALMRKTGYDPTKPGEFLEMSFGVACFRSGTLGIRFPASGRTKQLYLHKEERGWVRLRAKRGRELPDMMTLMGRLPAS